MGGRSEWIRTEGTGGGAGGGWVSRRAIADQRNHLTMFIMHGNMTASGEELATNMAASNRGRGRGSRPDHPPNNFGLTKSRLLGML